VLILDSPELKQFLFDNVQSLEELQILAWFNRKAGASTTQEEIARDTTISSILASEALVRLRSVGVLVTESSRPGEFRYNLENPIHEMLLELMSLYQAEPLGVIRLMTANAIERMRASALRAFADAFRLGKPK
jgi:hypothetical protein